MDRNGFTIIELMMVIVIASILATVAAPAFRTAIMNNRIVTETNDFVGDLNFARIEAIKRDTYVNLCSSTNGSSCNVTGGSWAGGWIVYWDSNSSGSFVTGKPILRKHGALDPTTTLNISGSNNQIVFTNTGGPKLGAVTAALCDSRGKSQGREIGIQATGEPTIASQVSTCTP